MMALYALVDKRSDEVRYCGKTAKPVAERVKTHLKNARQGVDYHVYRWIRKIGEENVAVLELPMPFGAADDAVAEKLWIAHLRARGCRLTNLTDGGEGMVGHTHTPEARAKMSASHQGKRHSAGTRAKLQGKKHSIETRAKMSAARKGKPKSLEHRANIGAALRGRFAGVTHSPERRARQSKAQVGHVVSAETRAKISAAHKARAKATREALLDGQDSRSD